MLRRSRHHYRVGLSDAANAPLVACSTDRVRSNAPSASLYTTSKYPHLFPSIPFNVIIFDPLDRLDLFDRFIVRLPFSGVRVLLAKNAHLLVALAVPICVYLPRKLHIFVWP